MRHLLTSGLCLFLLAACAPALQESLDVETLAPTQTAESGATLNATPGREPGLDAATVLFAYSGGFAGVQVEWRAFPDGRILRNGDPDLERTPAEVSALLSEIERLGFFQMKDSYGAMQLCNDCFTYQLTARSAEGAVKTVRTKDGAKDAPPELAEIISLVRTFFEKG